MQMVMDDFTEILRSGISVTLGGHEHKLRLCPVAVKGDLPFLIESAHLERHFRRAPKRGESGMQCPGVCHLCLAGMPAFNFEDCSATPTWERSMGSAAAMVPWESWAPWHDLPSQPDFKPYTFRPDLFHCFHLGHGRYFLSSALVILQQCERGGGVDVRFEALTVKWLAYCRSRRVS